MFVSTAARRFAAPMIACAVAALVAVAGCGSDSAVGGGDGTLRVALVDGPAASVDELHVTINRVEAHVDNDWVTITSVPQSFNLFDLVFDEAILGSAGLPAGHYTQVRLFPSDAWVRVGSETFPVEIPSGDQTGVKINVNYDITPNTITTVLLDFNVDKSLNQQANGQYRLQPVIHGVVKVLSGTVTGTVVDAQSNLVDGATVTAFAIPAVGDPVEINSSVTQEEGTFKVWALLPGIYRIVVTHDDGTVTVENVNVVANQNSDLGTLTILSAAP